MQFHHFGLAVYDFEPALSFFIKLGYSNSEKVVDELQNVELIFCSSNNQPSVELIKPINEKSPVYPFLKRNHEMIYHACYKVENIERALKEFFGGMRVILVSASKQAKLFENRRVAFYFIKGIGLIEFLEDIH